MKSGREKKREGNCSLLMKCGRERRREGKDKMKQRILFLEEQLQRLSSPPAVSTLSASANEFVPASQDVTSFNASVSACEKGTLLALERCIPDGQHSARAVSACPNGSQCVESVVPDLSAVTNGSMCVESDMQGMMQHQACAFDAPPVDLISFNAAISECEKNSLGSLSSSADEHSVVDLQHQLIQQQAQLQQQQLQFVNTLLLENAHKAHLTSKLSAQIAVMQQIIQDQQNDIEVFEALSACEKGSQSVTSTPIPDVISFNAAISACEKGTQSEDPSLHIDGRFSKAITACEKGSQSETSFSPSDIISFNAAISACEKGSQSEISIQPDVISFNAAISACGMGSRVSDHESQTVIGFRPDLPDIFEVRGCHEPVLEEGASAPGNNIVQERIAYFDAGCPNSSGAAISACDPNAVVNSEGNHTLEDVLSSNAAISACVKGSQEVDLVGSHEASVVVTATAAAFIGHELAASSCTTSAAHLKEDGSHDGPAFPPYEQTVSAAISATGKAFQQADAAAGNSYEPGPTPNAISSNAAITPGGKGPTATGGKKNSKKKKNKHMTSAGQGMMPNEISFNASTTACGEDAGAEENAAAFIGHEQHAVNSCSATEATEPTGQGMMPNEISFNASITACGEDARAEENAAAFNGHEQHAAACPATVPTSPDVIAFNAAVSGGARGTWADEPSDDESASAYIDGIARDITFAEQAAFNGHEQFASTASEPSKADVFNASSFNAALDGEQVAEKYCSATAAFNGHGQVATSHCSDTEPAAAVATSSCTLAEVSASFKGHEHLLVPGYLDAVAFLETLDAKYGVPL